MNSKNFFELGAVYYYSTTTFFSYNNIFVVLSSFYFAFHLSDFKSIFTNFIVFETFNLKSVLKLDKMRFGIEVQLLFP